MIVHEPKIITEADSVIISSQFEMQNKLLYIPDALWFSYPESFSHHVHRRSDGFAGTALFMAMYTGEDLLIRGSISPKLAYSLFEYQEIFCTWYSNVFQRVNIKFEDVKEPPRSIGKPAVISAFSGGVDSFYSLWANSPQRQPIKEAQVTHGLFVRGLDMRLDDMASYQSVADLYSQLFKKLGLELIQASTNAYQFSEFRINWKIFFGVPLIGAALCISPFLNRFYVPSGNSGYDRLVPEGSTPVVDHLLSTESVDVIHQGAGVTRAEKTAKLVEWPITHHNLRVCSDKSRMFGVNNCGICHKCYRTKLYLNIFESSQNYSNFGKKISVGGIIRWGIFTDLDSYFVVPIRNQAFEKQRFILALGIQLALFLNMFRHFTISAVKRLLSKNLLYKIKRKIYESETEITNE